MAKFDTVGAVAPTETPEVIAQYVISQVGAPWVAGAEVEAVFFPDVGWVPVTREAANWGTIAEVEARGGTAVAIRFGPTDRVADFQLEALI